MQIMHFINNVDLSWYNMFLDTVRAQERRGYDVWVVVPPSGANYKRLKKDNVRVISLEVRSSKLDYLAAWKLSSSPRSNGSTGSATAACSSPSATYRQRKPRPLPCRQPRSRQGRVSQTKQTPANPARFSFYSSRRLHSAIGYRSLADMERMAA